MIMTVSYNTSCCYRTVSRINVSSTDDGSLSINHVYA